MYVLLNMFLSIMVYHRIPSIVPHAVQWKLAAFPGFVFPGSLAWGQGKPAAMLSGGIWNDLSDGELRLPTKNQKELRPTGSPVGGLGGLLSNDCHPG